MRVRRRRKARGSVPGGLGACAASQRRASRAKKSQLYETQSHKKYSTFTTKISVTVFRRSPSPAAARCISDFLTSLRGKRNRESTHSTAPARARWFTARRRNAVRHPPSLPPQLHVGLHRVRRWRTVRAPLVSARSAVSRIRRGLGLNEFSIIRERVSPEPARRRATDDAVVPANRDSFERGGRPTAGSSAFGGHETPPETPRAFGRETVVVAFRS